MGKCEVCGNEYDKPMMITTADGGEHLFDSFECAIHAIAPVCAICSCRVIGHGVEMDGIIYCCGHCAHRAGSAEITDRSEEQAAGM